MFVRIKSTLQVHDTERKVWHSVFICDYLEVVVTTR